MLAELKLSDFLERLASREPTPGGGSAGALAAAVGTSLGLMAVRFSGLREDSPEQRLDALRAEFTALIDRDAQAYERVCAALRLPRGTPEAKEARGKAVQEALEGAARTPLEGLKRCVEALDLLEAFAPRCTPNLSSDLASGALALHAAARIMARNVAINISSLKKADLAAGLRKEMERCLERVNRASESVLSRVGLSGA